MLRQHCYEIEGSINYKFTLVIRNWITKETECVTIETETKNPKDLETAFYQVYSHHWIIDKANIIWSNDF